MIRAGAKPPWGLFLAVGVWIALSTAEAEPLRHSFAIGTNDFRLDGRRFQIRCGEVHAPRVPKEYWRHRLQMARAMGLNTVCAYLFWNLHEPKPGTYTWSGQADAAEFCRLAQEEGLWVILRPGPYSCAEWEMGGIPWWLLKEPDIKLRSRDPRFLEPARRYLKEVGRVLAPLQITRGGPIIMAQVENEYGFFGKDSEYMDEIRKALLDAGFDVPLFACNPPDVMPNGLLTNLFQAANFGTDPAGNFAKLRKFQPTGPRICSAFYPDWFDTWGQRHHFGNTERYLQDLKYMLEAGGSFSIYMAHGGIEEARRNQGLGHQPDRQGNPSAVPLPHPQFTPALRTSSGDPSRRRESLRRQTSPTANGIPSSGPRITKSMRMKPLPKRG